MFCNYWWELARETGGELSSEGQKSDCRLPLQAEPNSSITMVSPILRIWDFPMINLFAPVSFQSQSQSTWHDTRPILGRLHKGINPVDLMSQRHQTWQKIKPQEQRPKSRQKQTFSDSDSNPSQKPKILTTRSQPQLLFSQNQTGPVGGRSEVLESMARFWCRYLGGVHYKRRIQSGIPS